MNELLKYVRDRGLRTITLARCYYLAIFLIFYLYTDMWMKEYNKGNNYGIHHVKQIFKDVNARKGHHQLDLKFINLRGIPIRNSQHSATNSNKTCILERDITKFEKINLSSTNNWPSKYHERQKALKTKCDNWFARQNKRMHIVNQNPLENRIKHPFIHTRKTFRNLVAETRKSGLLYCVAYKVASTNWLKMLMILAQQSLRVNLDRKNDFEESEKHHVIQGHAGDNINMFEAHYYNQLESTDHYRRGWSANCVANLTQRYLTFFFARHPFERIVSAYLDKFTPSASGMNYIYQKEVGSFIARTFRKNASAISRLLGNDVTFPEFIQFLIYEYDKLGTVAGLYRPLVDTCNPCLIDYHIIGRFESFNSDKNFVLSQARNLRFSNYSQPQISKFPDLRHDTLKRQTRTNNAITKKYMSLLNKAQFEKLVEIYADDLELFDYSFHDYFPTEN